jgi:hypothetical protein
VYAGFGQAAVQAVKLDMPHCYSREFDECLDDPNTTYPGCRAIHEAWNRDDPVLDDAVDAAIEAVPFCSEKERYYWAGGGVLAGILVGSLIATLMP